MMTRTSLIIFAFFLYSQMSADLRDDSEASVVIQGNVVSTVVISPVLAPGPPDTPSVVNPTESTLVTMGLIRVESTTDSPYTMSMDHEQTDIMTVASGINKNRLKLCSVNNPTCYAVLRIMSDKNAVGLSIPTELKAQDCILQGEGSGISERTIEVHLADFQDHGIVYGCRYRGNLVLTLVVL